MSMQEIRLNRLNDMLERMADTTTHPWRPLPSIQNDAPATFAEGYRLPLPRGQWLSVYQTADGAYRTRPAFVQYTPVTIGGKPLWDPSAVLSAGPGSRIVLRIRETIPYGRAVIPQEEPLEDIELDYATGEIRTREAELIILAPGAPFPTGQAPSYDDSTSVNYLLVCTINAQGGPVNSFIAVNDLFYLVAP